MCSLTWKKLWVLSLLTVMLSACSSPPDATFSIVLDREKASRGEVVYATISGVNVSEVKVTVGGKPALGSGGESFTFRVPDDAPAGSQTVVFETSKGSVKKILSVLGNVVPDKLTLLLKPDVSESVLLERLTKLGFTLEKYRVLGAMDGPCASALADISTNGKPLGQAIGELEKEEIALYIDPTAIYKAGHIWSDYDSKDLVMYGRDNSFFYDYLSTIGAPVISHDNFTGASITVAILDTGYKVYDTDQNEVVDPFDAITGGTTLASVADGGDHGYRVASFLVGPYNGLTPRAKIMPVKTCDADRSCLSSNIIVGVCYALAKFQKQNKLDRLVLNLGLGGDTPIDTLRNILDYALKNGVPVAADVGNDGEVGSPKHYPAAFDLPGLVVVGTLQGEALKCIDFSNTAIGIYLPYHTVEGSTTAINGVNLTFKKLLFPDGSSESGSAGFYRHSRSNYPYEGYFYLNDITVQFDFPYPLESISFDYSDVDFRKRIALKNFEINGELRIFRELSELEGTTVGGARIYGKRALGNITQFSIGGELLPGDAENGFPILSVALGAVCPSNFNDWQPATFSTRSDYLDIVAPSGVDSYTGATAFSTSLVAGAIALWKQANPNLTPIEIEANLNVPHTHCRLHLMK